ncbi:MAG: N-acetyltransferase family protein [Armatimonadota bacterium]
MQPVVRVAGPTDADAFLALVDALADYEELPRPSGSARERLVRDAFSDRPRFTLLVGEVDGEVRGYAVVFETYSTFLAMPSLYLEDFFVHPDHRRSGLGTALFAHVEREALARGCGRLEWACLNSNAIGIGFYAKRQARHMDEWRAYRLTAETLRDRHSNKASDAL